jgi:hypothetical protein
MEMKIVLKFLDLSEESSGLIFDWIKNLVEDKNPENKSPLRYVDTIVKEVPNGTTPESSV